MFAVASTLVALGTAASVLATAALGLIAFVPFVGLAALPLQVGAWLVRGFVFQFLGLTALVAYRAALPAVARAGRRRRRRGLSRRRLLHDRARQIAERDGRRFDARRKRQQLPFDRHGHQPGAGRRAAGAVSGCCRPLQLALATDSAGAPVAAS